MTQWVKLIPPQLYSVTRRLSFSCCMQKHFCTKSTQFACILTSFRFMCWTVERKRKRTHMHLVLFLFFFLTQKDRSIYFFVAMLVINFAICFCLKTMLVYFIFNTKIITRNIEMLFWIKIQILLVILFAKYLPKEPKIHCTDYSDVANVKLKVTCSPALHGQIFSHYSFLIT